jgi:hypothetical protein
MKLDIVTKEDNRIRRMFEREFRNYQFDFAKNEIGGYAHYDVELCYTGYKFGYNKGKRG